MPPGDAAALAAALRRLLERPRARPSASPARRFDERRAYSWDARARSAPRPVRGGARERTPDRCAARALLLTLPLVTPRIRGADEIEYFSLPALARPSTATSTSGTSTDTSTRRDPRGLAGFKATFLDRREPATGRHINFAPLGSALLWSPFYLAGPRRRPRRAGLGSRRWRPTGSRGPTSPPRATPRRSTAFLGLLLMHDALVRVAAAFRGAPRPLAVRGALARARPLLYYMTLAPGFSHALSLFAVCARLWRCPLRASRTARPTLGDWAVVAPPAGLAAWCASRTRSFLAVPVGLPGAGRACAERAVARGRGHGHRRRLCRGRRVRPPAPRLPRDQRRFGPSHAGDAQDELRQPALLRGAVRSRPRPLRLGAAAAPRRVRVSWPSRGSAGATRWPAVLRGPAPAGLDQRRGGELDPGGRLRRRGASWARPSPCSPGAWPRCSRELRSLVGCVSSRRWSSSSSCGGTSR